jgi:hypothetical protein
MSTLEGTPFDNGPTCRGVNYVSSDGAIDMSRSTIEGRYPEGEHDWARNKVSRGLAHVVVGMGTLRYKDEPSVHVEAGQTVEIPPDARYAWQGYFDVVTTWNPPYDPKQHEVKEG